MKQVFDEALDGPFKLASGWNEALTRLEECQWGEGVHENYPFEKGEEIRIHVERHPANTILQPESRYDIDNLFNIGMGAITKSFKDNAVLIGHALVSEHITTIKTMSGLKDTGIDLIKFPENDRQWLGLTSIIDIGGKYILNITLCISTDNMPEDLKNDIFQTDTAPEALN